MTRKTSRVPSRLVSRVVCLFAPGTGKHRLYDKFSELSEQATRDHERAEEAEARAAAAELELERERSSNETLQGQLRTAMKANRSAPTAPDEKPAPHGFLERVLAQAPEDPPPPAPAPDEAATIPMAGLTTAFQSYKVVPLRDMHLLPRIPMQRVHE